MHGREHGIDVFDAVRLVDDDVLERELLEGGLLDETNLIRRHADFEVLRDEAGRDDLRALLRAAKDDDHCLNSRAQFWRVDLGTTTRWGPEMSR
jgi:hypothetical protein